MAHTKAWVVLPKTVREEMSEYVMMRVLLGLSVQSFTNELRIHPATHARAVRGALIPASAAEACMQWYRAKTGTGAA